VPLDCEAMRQQRRQSIGSILVAFAIVGAAVGAAAFVIARQSPRVAPDRREAARAVEAPRPATSSTPAAPARSREPPPASPLDVIATVRPEPAPSRQPTATAAPVAMDRPGSETGAASRARIEPAPDRWLVVSVHDGDTVNCVDHDKVQCKVRLVGIDAPEIGQPFGTVSRDRLRALVLRKSVTIQDAGKDRYGRTLGTLEIDGQDVNRQMVRDGLAWHYTRYSDDAGLAAAEREARADGRGLWRDPQPVPPWEWRAGERERKAATSQPASR
jgi:micrococcal nuclease